METISIHFYITQHLLIRCPTFFSYCRNNSGAMGQHSSSIRTYVPPSCISSSYFVRFTSDITNVKHTGLYKSYVQRMRHSVWEVWNERLGSLWTFTNYLGNLLCTCRWWGRFKVCTSSAQQTSRRLVVTQSWRRCRGLSECQLSPTFVSDASCEQSDL
jgi:hypothetical protein